MRSFSRKALAAGAVAAVGALGLGAGLAGAADPGSGGAATSDVQLVQTEPPTTVPDQAPDEEDARDEHCDRKGEGSETDPQASARGGGSSFRRL